MPSIEKPPSFGNVFARASSNLAIRWVLPAAASFLAAASARSPTLAAIEIVKPKPTAHATKIPRLFFLLHSRFVIAISSRNPNAKAKNASPFGCFDNLKAITIGIVASTRDKAIAPA